MIDLEIYNKLNPWITIIGFLFGAIGLGLTIWSIFFNKLKKQLKIQNYQTYTLFEKIDILEDFKILYKDDIVNKLNIAEIHIINDGDLTLDENDFLKHVSINLPDEIKVYKSNIYSSSEYNSLSINQDRNNFTIKISTFLKKEIIKFEIFYDYSQKVNINTEVAIKDGKISKDIIKSDNKYFFNKEKDEKTLRLITYYGLFFFHILPLIVLSSIIKFVLNKYNYSYILEYINEFNKTLFIIVYFIFVFYNVFRLYSKAFYHHKKINWIKIKQLPLT